MQSYQLALVFPGIQEIAMSESTQTRAPTRLVESVKVISKAGSVLEVRQMVLTPRGVNLLRSRSTGIRSSGDRGLSARSAKKLPATA